MNQIEPVRLGVIGLGMAGAAMVLAASRHEHVKLIAAADPTPQLRAVFERDFGGVALEDARHLCERRDIEAVYIATPHQFHRDHAILAARHGKHVIVEKPLALTLADCDAIIAAVDATGVHLIVGHTHGFDPNVRAMKSLIDSGEVGSLGLVAMWNYTNFIYRPRRPEELDTNRGGGILFNQTPHQIETVRVLGGDVRSVRAYARALDPTRPTEGLLSAQMNLESGAAASLVYSGYDHFDTDEWHFWIAESGAPKQPNHGAAQRALAARQHDESLLRTTQFGLGARGYALPAHQPHFGAMIVTCAHADLRASKDGVLIYDRNGVREVLLDKRPGVPGRREALDDLIAAVRLGAPPRHDARWGRHTLAVALAMLKSSRENREVTIAEMG